ncbi:hypothetical protein BO70DRAFT_60867 [Aspergillus heteromorphus CBS 117.55]|uniref:Uncharacterized protein n=1 Tax=Aspergillus heteromorphus CBS 117.55 TaxID=1448321 RepID=A0A317VZ25_9EURO|nr:uncharacterized protein BO70DRAFT_60867 [Aspergillus heteromorphus CBS 117.55]PWY78272.1 hypothetical protein BO70DRAFT_60867 [Aspergillus heteromorphus CBS 117.55]
MKPFPPLHAPQPPNPSSIHPSLELPKQAPPHPHQSCEQVSRGVWPVSSEWSLTDRGTEHPRRQPTSP